MPLGADMSPLSSVTSPSSFFQVARKRSYIGKHCGHHLRPFRVKGVSSGSLPKKLLQDANDLLLSLSKQEEAPERVRKILRDHLLERRYVYKKQDALPRMVSLDSQGNLVVSPQSREDGSCTVIVDDVALVGSHGCGTSLPSSDVDVAVVLSLDGPKASEFFLKNQWEFAEELLRWVRDIPAAEVKCQHPEKRKVECSLDGIDVDLLPTLSFHQLDPGRLRSSYRPRGLDAHTYSLNFLKCHWIRSQSSILRGAARLMKMWASFVCQAETKSPLVDEREEACKPEINTFAMTLVLAALHSNQPAKEPLELCIRAWRMLSKLRLDHLVTITFDETFTPQLCVGHAFDESLRSTLEELYNGDILGIAVEDVIQVDRMYRLSDSISFQALSIYSVCTLEKLRTANSWADLMTACMAWHSSDPDVANAGLQQHDILQRDADGEATCPAGHKLKTREKLTTIDCDACGYDSFASADARSCQLCDYDLCGDCWMKKRFEAQKPCPFQDGEWFAPLPRGPQCGLD